MPRLPALLNVRKTQQTLISIMETTELGFTFCIITLHSLIFSSLKIQYPNDEILRESHETIYRSLFIQARGVLKKELIGHLRSRRRIRRSQHSSKSGHSKGQIVEAISIRERPAKSEDRAVPGHWEGDLICGTKSSHMDVLGPEDVGVDSGGVSGSGLFEDRFDYVLGGGVSR